MAMTRDAIQVRDAAPPRHAAQADAQDVPPGYKRTEAGVIPEDWEAWRAGRMGEVITGKALAVYAPGAQRPYLRTKNVFDGRIDIDDVLTMPMTDAEFGHFRVLIGDVLLNEGQSLELVGRCAIYRGEYPQPCAIQNQLLRFRARAGTSSEFAAHLFRYAQKSGVFARTALQTTSIAHLGGSRFERLRLPWPVEESEQRAIAEALSDVDGLLRALEALIAKKRAIKQAAMQQLLTGTIRLPGFSGEWEMKRLGDVFWFKNGLNKAKRFFGTGTPIVNYMDVFGSPVLRASEVAGRVQLSRQEIDNFDVRKGDVFFTRTSETVDEIGRSAVMLDSPIDTVFSGFVLRARPLDQSICDTYKAYCFAAEGVRRQIVATASYTTRALTNGRLMSMVSVALPSADEQITIATVLSDMDAEIAALEARRDKTHAIKQGMMQQLLTGRVRLVKPAPAEVTA